MLSGMVTYLILLSAIGLLVMQTLGASIHEINRGIWADLVERIAPKVLIVSLFDIEATVWYNIPEFNILARNITVPGLSPLFPTIHCTSDCSVCQVITGEGEINAAASLAALVYSSSLFDLTHTYFLVAGIAGGNPKLVTTGSVTFARFAVQVGLQYEIDAREIPKEFSSGYFPLGTTSPTDYPATIYGTEVFEVSESLRQAAFNFAFCAKLNDSKPAQEYRSRYATSPSFYNATQPPSVVLCDTATSDTYWAGTHLAERFENTTSLWTNGTGTYCTTQQEDNAILEVLLRATISKLTDFSRIIIMRSVSDFDRPYPGQSASESLSIDHGSDISVTNLYRAGVRIVQGIMGEWDHQYRVGVHDTGNYIGDILGSLGGQPDFGPVKTVL